MPEGDSIARDAARLRPLLVGRPLVEVRHRGAPLHDLAGAVVEAIETRGKHLWIRLAGRDVALHVHLGMEGRWTLLSPEGLARAPGRVASASLALLNRLGGALVSRAPIAQVVRGPDARSPAARADLGPDVLAAEPDVEEMVRRARAEALRGRSVGDVLLDQRVAAGIGNLWKSELCWDQRVDPRAPIESVADDALRALFTRAAALMRRSGPRPSNVYRRVGRPCPRCGAPIVRVVDRPGGRGTYLCPRCQAGGAPA